MLLILFFNAIMLISIHIVCKRLAPYTIMTSEQKLYSNNLSWPNARLSRLVYDSLVCWQSRLSQKPSPYLCIQDLVSQLHERHNFAEWAKGWCQSNVVLDSKYHESNEHHPAIYYTAASPLPPISEKPEVCCINDTDVYEKMNSENPWNDLSYVVYFRGLSQDQVQISHPGLWPKRLPWLNKLTNRSISRIGGLENRDITPPLWRCYCRQRDCKEDDNR
jgi:hypothetical protein